MALVWSNLQECFSSPLVEGESSGLTQPDNWLHLTQNQTQLGPGDPRSSRLEQEADLHPGRGFEHPYQEFNNQTNAQLLPHQVTLPLPSHATYTPKKDNEIHQPTYRLYSEQEEAHVSQTIPQGNLVPLNGGCNSCASVSKFSTPISSLPRNTTQIISTVSTNANNTQHNNHLSSGVNVLAKSDSQKLPHTVPITTPTNGLNYHTAFAGLHPQVSLQQGYQRSVCNDDHWMIALIVFVGTVLLLACQR